MFCSALPAPEGRAGWGKSGTGAEDPPPPRRSGQPLTLLLVDLDGLKDINDPYGHVAGDTAIRTLADAIRAELRDTDTAARWGGDEFAIVAPNTSAAAALALAERIRTSVPAQTSRWRHGLARFRHRQTDEAGDIPDSAGLMRRADKAMYEDKRAGRNTIAAAPVEQPRDQPAPPDGTASPAERRRRRPGT